MKRIAGAITALSLAAVLAGCGSATAPSSSSDNSQANTGSTTSGSNGSGASSSSSDAQVVKVTAANFKWTLDKNTFKVGQPIEFDVVGQEGTHGFGIDGTDVKKVVSQGQTEKVTWTPPKSGKYTIRCDVFCGSGHGQMVTSFTVQ